MKTVNVIFKKASSYDDSKQYSYKCYDDKVKEGDLAVVFTQWGAKVVKIVSVDDYVSKKATKSIVQLIDTIEYDKRVTKERMQRELKEKMAQRAEEMKEITLYQAIAKNDSVMADLLKQYEEFTV